jgi:hypothetical protein
MRYSASAACKAKFTGTDFPLEDRMDQDINEFLSYEVKKEIADRYFSFRKLIEEDIKSYDDEVLASFHQAEQKIGFALVRLYILLKDEQLIHQFFKLAGLTDELFYDPYLAESPTIRKRVFTGQSVRGLTQASRFRNMIYDTYDDLIEHIRLYRKHLIQLSNIRETIVEEINLFYRQNDLGTIMGFLRGLEGSSTYKAGAMEGGLNPMADAAFEKKMRLTPPPKVEQLLPDIPQPVPLKTIRNAIKPIITKAWNRQEGLEMRTLVHP